LGGPPSLQGRLIRVGLVAAILLVPSFLLTGTMEKVLGGAWQTQLATVPPMALIFLSLVVLSGMAGQISLAQGALAGFGAFLAAHLVADHEVPFLLAAVLGAICTVPLGMLLASRATRLPPLFLGLATLAFGAVMDEWAFTNTDFSGGLSGVRFTRPDFLSSQRAYYLAGLAVFAIAAVLVQNLRNGRIGLALVAMRDTQTGIASLGADVRRLKLVTFCVSAFLAGLGGALFAGVRQTAAPQDWFTYLSLLFLTLAVVGGIASWSGALLGAAMFTLLAPILSQPVFVQNVVFKNVFGGQLPTLLPVFFGIGAIGLARNPHGAIEQTREGFADFRRRLAEREEKQARPSTPATPVSAPGNGVVTFARSTTYHREACVLATGKEALPVTGAKLRKLSACGLCSPDPSGVAPAARRRQPLRAQ
jgi:branched-chain amino acid transport system permease protein